MVENAQEDLIPPEEKLARRLLKRHNIIQPPFDLLTLVKEYAKVEFLPFPAHADGIVIGPKARKRPRIFVNSEIAETRKQFTLAHELGHVVIPWHIGNIVSHTENLNRSSSSSEYRQLENESNRFAAELLMPARWIKLLYSKSSSFQNFFEQVLEDSKASRDAALIKIFNCIPPGCICAEIESDGRIVKSFRSHRTIESIPMRYDDEEDRYVDEISFINSKHEEFSAGDKRLIVWQFEQTMKLPREHDRRPWKEIIRSIIEDTQLTHKLMSINAILASCFNANKGESLERIYYAVNHRFSKEEILTPVFEHPLFDQYIIKRINELKGRIK